MLPGRVVGAARAGLRGRRRRSRRRPPRDGTDETMPQERYLFRGSLLNKANTDKDFLLRYAEDELTNGSKDGGDKLPEIRKRAKEAKEAEEEDERMQRNSVIDMTALMKVKNVFKNKICGDIFSSAPKSYDGVLYKSRITTSKETSEAVDTMTMDMDDHDDDSDSLERGSHDSRPMSREAADELMKLGAESSACVELEGHDIEAVSSDDESEPEEDDEPTLALVGALFAAVADRSCGRRVLVEAKNKVLHRQPNRESASIPSRYPPPSSTGFARSESPAQTPWPTRRRPRATSASRRRTSTAPSPTTRRPSASTARSTPTTCLLYTSPSPRD